MKEATGHPAVHPNDIRTTAHSLAQIHWTRTERKGWKREKWKLHRILEHSGKVQHGDMKPEKVKLVLHVTV